MVAKHRLVLWQLMVRQTWRLLEPVAGAVLRYSFALLPMVTELNMTSRPVVVLRLLGQSWPMCRQLQALLLLIVTCWTLMSTRAS